MINCKYCDAEIDDRTDDHYNSDHSKIKCDSCGEWQNLPDAVMDIETSTYLGFTGEG